ncbi:MAG TPA: hypothetical protein VMN36_19150 [Verrucomicrobiales bacterium]|nr:hypothetical protein [Verrucomicrobiales bacterium]
MDTSAVSRHPKAVMRPGRALSVFLAPAAAVRFAVAVALALVSQPAPIDACQVPVFRYALERWAPDPFHAVLFHPGEPSPELRETLAVLEAAALHANLQTEVHRIDTLTEEQLWSLDLPPSDPHRAVIQVFSHGRAGARQLCLELEANPENAALLVDSPCRQSIVQSLSQGSSAVWILLEGSSADQNALAWSSLGKTLAETAPTLTIPEGVIPPAAAAASRNEGGPVELDNVLRSGIPLRIEFTPIRLPRDDPAESALIAQIERLRSLDPALPYAVPVFGRGRVLPPLPAAPLDPAAVAAACRYLTEACSCQVKSENPGADFLLKADWNILLDQSWVVLEKTLPPLEGAGILLADASRTPSPASSPTSSQPSPVRLSWIVVASAALLAIVFSTAAAVLLLRRPRP